MSEKLILKKYEVEALLTSASRDVTRRHLNAVKFDGAQGVCASTDGHRLTVRHGGQFEGEFLIARASLELVAKLMPKTGAAEFSTERIAVLASSGPTDGLASVRPRLIDAEFPPIFQVFNGYGAKAQMGPICLNPKFLADACKVFANLPGRHPGMVVTGAGEFDPVEIVAQDIHTHAHWHVLVMPMRFGDADLLSQSARLKASLAPAKPAAPVAEAKPSKVSKSKRKAVA